MFCVQRKAFEHAVGRASRLGAQSAVPAARVVKFSGAGDGVLVSATDLESTIVYSLPTTEGVAPDGTTLCVDPKRVLSVTRVLPRELADLPLVLSSDELVVGASRVCAAMQLADYPSTPSMNGNGHVEISLDESFADSWAYVRQAVARESIMGALTGVLFDFARGFLVASDGKRLHAAPIPRVDRAGAVLVRPKVLELLDPQDVRVPLGKPSEEEPHFVTFANGEGIAMTRIMDLKFPDYANVIPAQTSTNVAVVDQVTLAEVLREARANASPETLACVLTIGKDALTVTVRDKESGDAYKQTLGAKTKGKQLQVTVNPNSLLDAINHPTWRVSRLQFQDSERAIRITGSEPDILAVLMPLKLR